MVGCRELIILADNDAAGCGHAERVAAITHALNVAAEPIVVKVLALPGAPVRRRRGRLARCRTRRRGTHCSRCLSADVES